ncbi:MAG TPA: RDD family protein [Bacillota bacterium]|jgi:uncharacterized RDD family membrane protein YckC|nr:RDD family protein [Bacillota bacterium]HOL08597.1 RDD family protein [Bacillota bacterium]HPO98607.1 RDD family protein [Bacillota bacterium]
MKETIVGARMCARLIDGFMFNCLRALGIVGNMFYNSFYWFIWIDIVSVLYLIYSIYFHYKDGQTIGKKCMGIVVKGTDSEKLRLWQVICRETIIWMIIYFVQIVKILNYLQFNMAPVLLNNIQVITLFLIMMTLITMLLNQQKRAFYDLLAKTVVVLK